MNVDDPPTIGEMFEDHRFGRQPIYIAALVSACHPALRCDPGIVIAAAAVTPDNLLGNDGSERNIGGQVNRDILCLVQLSVTSFVNNCSVIEERRGGGGIAAPQCRVKSIDESHSFLSRSGLSLTQRLDRLCSMSWNL